jgi:hypothetical protein
MKSTEHYRYLWDGTEPEWVLLRVNRQVVNLTLVFGPSGPSPNEITGVRRAVPAYAALSSSEALARLRGNALVHLGDFDSREARRIADACRKNGCEIRELVRDESGYLPLNERTNACLLIEDNALSKEVCEEALKHGVRVRHVEV